MTNEIVSSLKDLSLASNYCVPHCAKLLYEFGKLRMNTTYEVPISHTASQPSQSTTVAIVPMIRGNVEEGIAVVMLRIVVFVSLLFFITTPQINANEYM